MEVKTITALVPMRHHSQRVPGKNYRLLAGRPLYQHDYGYRLSYWGFLKPNLWDTQGDQVVERLSGTTAESFDQEFAEKTKGCDYFLVTLINDFNSQQNLHDYLLANYPYEQGEGYYLFDLRHPLTKSGS